MTPIQKKNWLHLYSNKFKFLFKIYFINFFKTYKLNGGFMKKFFTLFLLIFVITSFSFSQNLENRMNKYTAEFGSGYSLPLTEAVGLLMNNGWVSVKAMKDLFSVDFGITAVFVPVLNSDKQFLVHSPYDGTLETVSTVVGPSTVVPIHNNTGLTVDPVNYPKGFELGLIPVVFPQASIGNILGTRLTIRALPKFKTGDLGYFSLFGAGLQHMISSDFKQVLPLDFGVGFAYQNMNLGDIMSANAYNVYGIVSKRVWKINFYSLLGYDYSKMKFSYTTTYFDITKNDKVNTTAAFENEGKNGLKLGVGGSAETRFARFNAGMTFLPKFCFNLSMGVGFGLKKPF
jgi:hypothetical protein